MPGLLPGQPTPRMGRIRGQGRRVREDAGDGTRAPVNGRSCRPEGASSAAAALDAPLSPLALLRTAAVPVRPVPPLPGDQRVAAQRAVARSSAVTRMTQ